MSCQHPNCSRPMHSTCMHHCHWSLCETHINEHKISLLTEFDQLLQNLVKPTNDLLNSIELQRKQLNQERNEQIELLKRTYENELIKINQESMPITKYQSQFNEISEDLIKIKTNEIILKQEHFQQIDALSKHIEQYKDCSSAVEKQEASFSVQEKSSRNMHCPLVGLHAYGLLPSHNVTLCTSNKKVRNLFEHLSNYHHLTNDYANEIYNASLLNLDPTTTKIFPPNAKVTTIDTKHPCPLHKSSWNSGIPHTPCVAMVTDKFLPIHLRTAHRLRKVQIDELINHKPC